MLYIFIPNGNFYRRVRLSNSLKLPNVECRVVLIRLPCDDWSRLN